MSHQYHEYYFKLRILPAKTTKPVFFFQEQDPATIIPATWSSSVSVSPNVAQQNSRKHKQNTRKLNTNAQVEARSFPKHKNKERMPTFPSLPTPLN